MDRPRLKRKHIINAYEQVLPEGKVTVEISVSGPEGALTTDVIEVLTTTFVKTRTRLVREY